MKIKYDKKADAKYISIKKGKINYTKRNNDWLLFDYSKRGDVLGVEILNASKNSISVYTIKEKFVGFEILKSSPGVSNRENRDDVIVTAQLSNNFDLEHSFSMLSSNKIYA